MIDISTNIDDRHIGRYIKRYEIDRHIQMIGDKQTDRQIFKLRLHLQEGHKS